LNMVPPIAEEAVDKTVIKDEPQGERKDSKKIKKKSKKRSKSKKSKRSVEDTVAEEAASSQMPETDIRSPKPTLDNEVTAINVDQLNMVPPITEAAVEIPKIKDEPIGEKKASEKIKKKSKKRSKSKKSKKTVEDTVSKEAESSHMPETAIISPKPTLDNEVTAINVDQLNMVPPITEAAVEIPKIKDEPIGERKDLKKIRKKSKKRSKSKKSKKSVEDTVAEEAASSQMPETDTISPKHTLDNEVTAINIDHLNMVPPIAEEAVDKTVIKDEPQGERKDSKKIKKKSKKRSKSKKSKRSVEDTVAEEAASSQMPETDIRSPKPTLDNEVTAINVDQLNMVPPITEAAVEIPKIKDEPIGEKKASEKIKKKSKKRSKSKKSKKTVEDTVSKEAESSHMPETAIISPKPTLDNEVTAINVDQLNMVPPITEAAVEI
ncbi:Zonadhesin, partial [Trichinella murrelli]